MTTLFDTQRLRTAATGPSRSDPTSDRPLGRPLPNARRTAPLLVPALALLLATLVGAPSPSRAQDRSFSEATQVTVVEVPVQVVRHGEPLRNLRAEDFRIFDEGEPREIASFEMIDRSSLPSGGSTDREDRPATSSPAMSPAPAAVSALEEGSGARRHLLLFFDLAFSGPQDLARAERAARNVVEHGLHPSDLVGVAFYAPRNGASLVLRFTSDHSQVLGVLDAFRALLEGDATALAEAVPVTHGVRRIDPLGLSAGASGATLADIGKTRGSQRLLIEQAIAWAGPYNGRGGLELNKLQNAVWNQQQQIEDRRSGDIANLADALAAVARETAGIAGPKELVMFSRGFDVELLHVKTHGDSVSRGPEDAWFPTGGGSWILTKVESALGEMRQAGWSIQAIDLAGSTSRLWAFREGLFFLADETGGALYESTNDPEVALREMIERTAVTYLLSFQVADLPEEPALRRLRVEIDGLPRGAEVVHRAAYERPRPWSDLPLRRRRAESAEALLAGADRDNLDIQVMALPLRDGADGWSVPVALEMDGLSLLAGDVERTPGAEIYVYAFDADGGVVDLVAHRIDFRKPETRGRLTVRGLKFLAELSLPAGGRYRLRFLVRSLRNGETALRTVPLTLPSRESRAVLLPPVLLEHDPRSWVVTTEVDAGPGPHRRPFTLHGHPVTPAVGIVQETDAANGSEGGDRVLVLGYGLADAAQRLQAVVVGEDGAPAGEVTFLARTPGDGVEPDLVIAVLPPGLAPGTYSIHVSLTGEDGTVRGQTSARFRLQPRG